MQSLLPNGCASSWPTDSEADLAVLRHQLDTVEPLRAGERASTLSVRTDADVNIGAIVSAVRQAIV